MFHYLEKRSDKRSGNLFRFTLVATIFCSLAVQLSAQTSYTISGRVTNNVGGPIPGADVIIIGTTIGDNTDLDGNYSIKALLAEGDIEVRFSFIGYTTDLRTITLGSATDITEDVSLGLDVLKLSEVVVTGASGLQEKRQLGNTIATVSGASVANSGAVDISGSLSGKLAGVQVTQNSGDPAAGISVRLRSSSTVNGSSDPLYIIDGVIVNNTSSNVLGVNSVVQNRLSDISPQDIDRIEVIKGGAAAAIYGSRASNGVVQIFTKQGQRGKPKVTFSTKTNFNSLRKKIAYNDAPLAWDSDTTTVAATRYDYQDMVFQNSTGTDNYLSVSGGQGKTTYLGSVSWLQNDGIMKNTDFQRTGTRLRVNQIINDWASFSVGTYVATSKSNDMPNGGYGYGVLQTILFADNVTNPEADEDGNYPAMTFYPNILEYLNTFEFKQTNKRAISDIQFTLSPVKGMRVKYVFGYDDASSRGTRYSPIGTTTALTGSARASIINRTQMNSDLNVTYNADINAISSTTAAGYSFMYDESSVGTISGSSLALGVKTTAGAGSIATTDYLSKRSIWGSYVQQTFGLQNKLFLTAAARVDGSSGFGMDNRNQFYPKGSVSYVLSDEGFWPAELINDFKVRAAWGQAGNLTAIGPFDRLTNYSAVSIGGNSGLISPTQIGNPELSPERQTETEFGFDMAMLNNRLGLEFTSYSQVIEDLLLARALAPSTGAGTRIENIGNMTNKGIELQLTGTPIMTRDFNWLSTLTYSANKNEVSDVPGTTGEISIGNFGFAKARNGEPLGVFRQGFYARNDDGSLLLTAGGLPQRERGSVDENGNNVIERTDGQPSGALLQKVIGDPNPDFVASFTNELKYKKFNFRAQFDMVQGFDVLSWDSRMLYRFGGGAQSADELNGDAVKGTGTAKFGIAESYIEDGSFIKLRELSATYTMDSPIKGMSSLQFTLAGRNLLSIDNYSKWDPEVNMDAQSNGSRGGIMGLVPIPRTVTIGVTTIF